MANLPKRPLDFERVIKSDEARRILKEETLLLWGAIFGWTGNVTQQSQGSQSTRNAVKSPSPKTKR